MITYLFVLHVLLKVTADYSVVSAHDRSCRRTVWATARWIVLFGACFLVSDTGHFSFDALCVSDAAVFWGLRRVRVFALSVLGCC